VKIERCYRCFEPFPAAELTEVTARCGCTQGYCLECVARPGFLGFLGYVASRCVKIPVAA
jgi:hypothetical protein